MSLFRISILASPAQGQSNLSPQGHEQTFGASDSVNAWVLTRECHPQTQAGNIICDNVSNDSADRMIQQIFTMSCLSPFVQPDPTKAFRFINVLCIISPLSKVTLFTECTVFASPNFVQRSCLSLTVVLSLTVHRYGEPFHPSTESRSHPPLCTLTLHPSRPLHMVDTSAPHPQLPEALFHSVFQKHCDRHSLYLHVIHVKIGSFLSFGHQLGLRLFFPPEFQTIHGWARSLP